MIHQMIALRIVLAVGVAILYLMNVISVAVTTAFVLTVPVFQTVLHMKMSVMIVMMTAPMTVYRIVRAVGVAT